MDVEEASTSGEAPFDAKELNRALMRMSTAGIRAAFAGFVIRGGLHALSSLVFMLGKLRNSKKKRELSWARAIEDTLKYTAFLGAMGVVYVGVDEGIAAQFGNKRTAKWRALVAGALAGQTLLITGSQTQYSLGTYVLLRGLTLLIRTANKPGADPRLRALLAPTRMQHGDTALMCMAAAQIVYSFIMMPSTLPRSYVRFIAKQAAKGPWVWKAVQEQALRNSKGEQPGRLNLLKGTPYAHLESRIPCQFYHPGQTCHKHAVGNIPQSYLRALGVYVPVYLVPALLVHRQNLVTKPLDIWPKLAVAIARSSLFLTTYIALAFSSVCIAFNATGTSTGPLIAASTWVGGLATLIEKKSRRMELALYCLSRALESFFRCLSEWGVVDVGRVPARMDVLLFSAGCAAIMSCYSGDHGQHRDVFRSKYMNVLDFIFGNQGLDQGTIHHLPSNQDLLITAARRMRTYSRVRLSDVDLRRPRPDGGSSSSSSSDPDLRQRKQQKQQQLPGSSRLQASSSGSNAWDVRPPVNGGGFCGGDGSAEGEVGRGTFLADTAAQLGTSPREPCARGMRRSATDPGFGPCEGRVHGADRGIRSGTRMLQGEPSLSSSQCWSSLLLPPLHEVEHTAAGEVEEAELGWAHHRSSSSSLLPMGSRGSRGSSSSSSSSRAGSWGVTCRRHNVMLLMGGSSSSSSGHPPKGGSSNSNLLPTGSSSSSLLPTGSNRRGSSSSLLLPMGSRGSRVGLACRTALVRSSGGSR